MALVRPAAPALLPVFRSRLTGDLLALVLAHPERSWTLDELATRTGAAYQTVTGEVRRLEQAGVIAAKPVGRSKLVSVNDASPYRRPLAELVLMAFGPPLVVAEEFAGVEGVEKLLLYGSWAARHAGVSGKPPGDVDVLVLGDVDRDDVYDAARRAERRLGREVSTTIRSSRAWDRAGDAFATTVKSSPTLELPGPWAS